MATEPPDHDRDIPNDEIGGETAFARKLPPDLRRLARKIDAANEAREKSPDAPLHQFERFEVSGYMGGGMGLVLAAYDPELDRRVAIKLWMHDGAPAEAALRVEAKALARVSHPNIVPIYEIGTWGERIYFVMEWIDGVDGTAWMREHRSWEEIHDVFLQAGRGLAAAHDVGIQHRDFKPSNMLIGHDGRVRVVDFGVAEIVSGSERENAVGMLAGTTQYMAPERLYGLPGDARSDIFSFCVTMWQAMYGVRPFAGATAEQLIESIQAGSITGDVADPGRPHWMMLTALYGLALLPSERYDSMHELLRALEEQRPPTEDGDEREQVRLGGASLLHEIERRRGARKVTRSFLAGVAVSGAVFVAYMLGVRSASVRVVAEDGETPRSHTATDSAEPEPPEADGAPVTEEPIIAVEEVIAHIEGGTYNRDIKRKWKRECLRRRGLGISTYNDTLMVGEKMLESANEYMDGGNKDAARAAALAASAWGYSAADDLEYFDLPSDPGEDLANRALAVLVEPVD